MDLWLGVMGQLTPKFMNRVQGMELELLTSQHYNFPASILTQERLHEVVSHREQFCSWRDISKYNGEKIIPSGHSLHNSQSQQCGGIMNYLGKSQCPAPDKPSNQRRQQAANSPTISSSSVPNSQQTNQQTANQYSPTRQPAYQVTKPYQTN